jgi:hypothetical protein
VFDVSESQRIGADLVVELVLAIPVNGIFAPNVIPGIFLYCIRRNIIPLVFFRPRAIGAEGAERDFGSRHEQAYRDQGNNDRVPESASEIGAMSVQ